MNYRAALMRCFSVALSIGLLHSMARPAAAQLEPEIAVWPQSFFLLPSGLPQENTLSARSRAGGPRNPEGAEIRLLREKDPAGYKRYTLMVGSFGSGDGALQFRARFRKDGHSGLAPSTRTSGVGIAMPWRQYALEIEGVHESDIGKSLLGTLRWRDETNRVECGLTVPLLAPEELRRAVIFQFIYRFGPDGARHGLPGMTAAQLGYRPPLSE